MYPNKYKRLQKETIGSHSKAVIGILIATMVLAVGLSILGVWGNNNAKNGVQKDDNETPFTPENKPLDNKISEEKSAETKISNEIPLEIKPNEVDSSKFYISEDDFSGALIVGSSDVSVLEGTCINDLDTVPGQITITEEVLPNEPLPLCITQEWLDQYYVIADVTGGYEPLGGIIIVTQGEGDKAECRGLIKIIPEPVSDGCCDNCCVPKEWKFTFQLCDGPICLESNHLPIVPDGWWTCPDKTLQKEVDLCIKTKWAGCCLEEQEFIVILAHKAMSQNPQLSMRDTSPVCK